MSGVKRYDCTNGKAQHCYGCYEMTECELGDYVSSGDYDQLKSELDTEIQRRFDGNELSSKERNALHAANQRLEGEAAIMRSALQWIAKVNAMDYEYVERAKRALAALSTNGEATK